MTTIYDIRLPPEYCGKSFRVGAVARDQSDTCKGCLLAHRGCLCGYDCLSYAALRDNHTQVQVKRVRDGEIVKDRDGNLYTAKQINWHTMEFVPQRKDDNNGRSHK